MSKSAHSRNRATRCLKLVSRVHSYPRSPRFILSLTISLLVCGSGCEKTETRFDITSYLDPAYPEEFTERFEPGSFAVNSLGDIEIVFELEPSLVDVWADGPSPEGTPGPQPDDQHPEDSVSIAAQDDGPVEEDVVSEVWMSQILQVRMLWSPRPGTTYAERTQTNASIVYCLLAGEDAISYEGAGFVYFEFSRDGKTIEGAIESAALFPTRWRGKPNNLFGRCHLTGEFTAVESRREIADAHIQLRRLLGPPLMAGGEDAGAQPLN